MANFHAKLYKGQVVNVTVGVDNESKNFGGVFVAMREFCFSDEATLSSRSKAEDLLKEMVAQGILVPLPCIEVSIPKNLHEQVLEVLFSQGPSIARGGADVPAIQILRFRKYDPETHTRKILFRVETFSNGTWREETVTEDIFQALRAKDAVITLCEEQNFREISRLEEVFYQGDPPGREY